MKKLLTILLMLCLALPGTGWARLLESTSCGAAASGQDCSPKLKPHCACCEAGQCACAESGDKTPPHPLPALPPRPASAGDPIFSPPPTAFDPLAVVQVPVINNSMQLGEHLFVAVQAVPLYVRNCSFLW